MTTAASHDSLDPAANRQIRRADELEHWLTGLRTDLNQDPFGWLEPHGDAADVSPSTPPKPSQEYTGARDGTPARPTDPSRSAMDDPPGPPAGRHRAAD
jgi:hypothetical protein